MEFVVVRLSGLGVNAIVGKFEASSKSEALQLCAAATQRGDPSPLWYALPPAEFADAPIGDSLRSEAQALPAGSVTDDFRP